MNILSLIGILVGLIVMILLAYKGHSIIWVAPLCAFIVALFSLGAGLGEGRTLLSSYTVDYMKGVGNYFIDWFPIFLLGAIYGKIMDITGAAKALADLIIKLIGPRYVVLAVLIPCILLTYGGVSLFVVVFIMFPMGSAIFRSANVPRTLLPPVIALGSFGITMTAVPGTPQIQNLIPMNYFGTPATAAPVLGITASILMIIPGYLYLNRRIQKAKTSNLGYDGTGYTDSRMNASDTCTISAGNSCRGAEGKNTSSHWISALLPLIVVFFTLNVLNWNIVISLILGIFVCCLFNIRQAKKIPIALTEGAKGSVTAIMNTASAVGFGSVLRVMPGFALLAALLVGEISGVTDLLFSVSLSSGVMSSATASASGGLAIALDSFGAYYLEIANQLGISPDLLHRFAAIAAGAMDKLPHSGSVITLLAVTNCTHKESYRDIFVATVLIPTVIVFALIPICGFVI